MTSVSSALTYVGAIFYFALFASAANADLLSIDHVSKSPRGRMPASFLAVGGAPAPIGDTSLSRDGRFVVFTLTPAPFDRHWMPVTAVGSSVGHTNVYVHDRRTERTSIASRTPDGSIGNGNSVAPTISANGRFVAFVSDSSNLIDGVRPDGKQVFLRDLTDGSIEILKMGVTDGPNRGVSDVSLSANGRLVAFTTDASNLSSLGDGRFDQVYLHDRKSGKTTLISTGLDDTIPNGGSLYPQISSDGSSILFRTLASNIHAKGAGVLVYRRSTGGFNFVNERGRASLSGNGRYVAFGDQDLLPNDSDGYADVYVADLNTGEIEQVDVASDGQPSNHYSFVSDAPFISENGRFVSFTSSAWNLVAEDIKSEMEGRVPSPFPGSNTYDVFLRDLWAKKTICLSQKPDGTPLNQNAGAPWDGAFFSPGPSNHAPAISADGSTVSFVSAGGNLLGLESETTLRNQIYVATHRIKKDAILLNSGDRIFDDVAARAVKYYEIDTDEYSRLTVVLDNLNHNADLLVRKDALPKNARYSCKSTRMARRVDVCDSYNLTPGKWFIAVRGRKNSTTYRLSVKLSHAWPVGQSPTLIDTNDKSFRVRTMPGETTDYAVWLEPRQYLTTLLVTGDAGGADLFLRKSETANEANYDCGATQSDVSLKRCATDPARKRQLWFVRVHGRAPDTDCRLRIRVRQTRG